MATIVGQRIALDVLLRDYLAWEAEREAVAPPRSGPLADVDAEAFVATLHAIADRRRRNQDRPAFPTRLMIALHYGCDERTITRLLERYGLDLRALAVDWRAVQRRQEAPFTRSA